MESGAKIVGSIAPMMLNSKNEESKFVQKPPTIPPINGEYNLDAVDMDYV